MFGADICVTHWSWLFDICLGPLLDDFGALQAYGAPFRSPPVFASTTPWTQLSNQATFQLLRHQIRLAEAYVIRADSQARAFEAVYNYQLVVVQTLREVPHFEFWSPISSAQAHPDVEGDSDEAVDTVAFHWAAPYALRLLAVANNYRQLARQIETEARLLLVSAQEQEATFRQILTQRSADLARNRSRSSSADRFSTTPPGGHRRERH
jgi:hypothetical protein